MRLLRLALPITLLFACAEPAVNAAVAQKIPKACGYVGTATVAKLAACLDSLTVKAKLWEAQGRPSFADLYNKMPPNGQTVAQYVASSVASGGGGPASNVVNGDLIVNGRICIPDACLGDAGEQIQIRSQKAAAILFQSNRDGTWNQSPCAGISTVGMSPDLGLRLIQNQRWTPDGVHIDNICPANGVGAVGFDSQAEWSFNGHKPGMSDIGTQRLVLRTDEANKIVYFATWAEGWKVEFRGSTDGCKWCENVRWAVPYQ